MFCARLFFVSVIALYLAVVAVAEDKQDKPAKNVVESELPPGSVVVDEDVWVRLIDEPSVHMDRAHDGFVKKNFKLAADEMRKTASYLHIAARNATTTTKAGLSASAQELERLAKNVENGTEQSVKKLESAFGRAERALAEHHQINAKSALDRKRNGAAGRYLRSAVGHVENAAKWSGQELESGAAKTAEGVRTVAEKLVDGSGVVVNQAGKGIKWLGSEIQKLGTVIESDKSDK
jgi:hypothetical protein